MVPAVAEPGQLAGDSSAAQPDCLRPSAAPTAGSSAGLVADRRGGTGPAAPNQIAVPAQHRVGRDEQPRPAAARNQPAQGRLQRPVRPGRLWSGDRPAQHGQLVAQNEDLDVLRDRSAGEQAEPVHEPAIMPDRFRWRTATSGPMGGVSALTGDRRYGGDERRPGGTRRRWTRTWVETHDIEEPRGPARSSPSGVPRRHSATSGEEQFVAPADLSTARSRSSRIQHPAIASHVPSSVHL